MSVKQRKILKIVVVIVVVVLGFCLNESGILPALGGMGLMFAVFLPISAIPFAVLLMTGVFWRISSTQRLERRLGISLLAAGLLIGLGLPAWGNLQTPAFRVIASIFIS